MKWGRLIVILIIVGSVFAYRIIKHNNDTAKTTFKELPICFEVSATFSGEKDRSAILTVIDADKVTMKVVAPEKSGCGTGITFGENLMRTYGKFYPPSESGTVGLPIQSQSSGVDNWEEASFDESKPVDISLFSSTSKVPPYLNIVSPLSRIVNSDDEVPSDLSKTVELTFDPKYECILYFTDFQQVTIRDLSTGELLLLSETDGQLFVRGSVVNEMLTGSELLDQHLIDRLRESDPKIDDWELVDVSSAFDRFITLEPGDYTLEVNGQFYLKVSTDLSKLAHSAE